MSPACSRRPACDFDPLEHGAIGLPAVDDDHEQVVVLEGHHVHQSADDRSRAGQCADLLAQFQRHAFGELHGAAPPLHDQVGAALGVEREERAFERLGDADQRHDGRDGRRQPRRGQQ